jgi:putative chitinase
MQPIVEQGGPAYLARMYDPDGLRPAVAARLGNTEGGDGCRFCGRGYVQLTGRANYQRAGLADDPERALDPAVAAEVLERGLREGWFTGARLMDVLPLGGPATRAQFTAARRVVNGKDRAALIADYAVRFQDALLAGGCG